MSCSYRNEQYIRTRLNSTHVHYSHAHELLAADVTAVHASLRLALVIHLVSLGVALILEAPTTHGACVLRLAEVVLGDLVAEQRLRVAELATAEVARVVVRLVLRFVVIGERLVVLVPSVVDVVETTQR